MPWKVVTVMSQRKEFVSLASAEDVNISELCRLLTSAVRKVDQDRISFHCRRFRIGKAFNGEYIALRPTNVDGVYEVMFSNHKIDEIDLK